MHTGTASLHSTDAAFGDDKIEKVDKNEFIWCLDRAEYLNTATDVNRINPKTGCFIFDESSDDDNGSTSSASTGRISALSTATGACQIKLILKGNNAGTKLSIYLYSYP